MTTAHLSGSDRLPPAAVSFLRQINEWAIFASQRVELMMELFKRLLGKSATDFGREMERVVRIIADDNRAKMLAPACRWRVSADHEFLA
jgi:hypothetical protein